MANHPIRVLLVDDDEDYYVLTRALLSDIVGKPYQLDWVARYDDALRTMQTNVHDVCLLDFHLGQHTGLELLRAALASNCQAPMIMLTGQGDHEVDLEAMRAGAADYLTKGRTDAALLERAIRYALERRRTLEALRESQQHIAQLYEQEQSQRRELEQAYADLRQAEALRDDLTRMIVHDLRSPLTVIISSLHLLGQPGKYAPSADAAGRWLDRARTASQRMLGMISDLLEVSKLEAGELQLKRAPLLLPALLAEKEDGYRSQAARDNRTFEVRVRPGLPHVMADAELIGRVIDNLVSNAFKYTEPGGRIELQLEGDGQGLIARVRDDGMGIPAEYRERIFEKFVQVTDPQTGAPVRKGTGLGLAFCRMVVEAHGGRIWVDSAPGQGSTFVFVLPASV